MRVFVLMASIELALSAQTTRAPKIWDDQALEDWATPIAALGIRPGHFSAAEYYAAPADNLKTYPVYRPDKEPPGYWEWLQKQKPEPLVDASKLRTREDWIKAGETAFQYLDDPLARTADPLKIAAMRDPKAWDGVWTQADGSLRIARWAVTEKGVQVAFAACANCHAASLPDGATIWGAPIGNVPDGKRLSPVDLAPISGTLAELTGEAFPLALWRQFTVPWAPDPRIEKLLDRPAEAMALIRTGVKAGIAVPRTHGSPFYTAKIPDLRPLHFSRYLDATGTHRLRGPEDVARYAAFVTGADPIEFGPYKILTAEQRRIRFRYADETLYAIGLYLFSLEAPRNPAPSPAALVARGRDIFIRETCVKCHVPPDYTNGKLTLAQGFQLPADHPNGSDVVHFSVGTDPGLALKTRKGTGFYKVPSLRGLWYRPALLHDASAATLEEMFDPDRLSPDHVPGGWKGPGVTKRAIPGHPFGLALNAEDKTALLAFLRSL
jgi:hypothetical protein